MAEIFLRDADHASLLRRAPADSKVRDLLANAQRDIFMSGRRAIYCEKEDAQALAAFARENRRGDVAEQIDMRVQTAESRAKAKRRGRRQPRMLFRSIPPERHDPGTWNGSDWSNPPPVDPVFSAPPEEFRLTAEKQGEPTPRRASPRRRGRQRNW